MNRKYIIPIAILIVAVVIVLAYCSFTQKITPASTPPMLYDCNLSVLNPQVTKVAGYNSFFNNVSQGLPLQVNMTFTSMATQPITIPIENLRVTYYSSTVDLHRWIDDNGNYSLIQQQAFSYSFSLSQLTLQPAMSNSTLLVINLAQNAPVGQYSIEINLGNVKAINANENSQLLSYSETIGLEMIVTPKTT
jgi:uncharacterized membrane protein